MYFPKGFDLKRAVQLANLVKQAYGQLEAFQKKTNWALHGKESIIVELQYRGVDEVPGKGVLSHLNKELHRYAKSKLQEERGLPIGFIAGIKTETYLVFRGTMTTAELIRDFGIHVTPYPYADCGKVHDGFIQTYGIFRKSILDTLKSISPGRSIYIAGHSLGAALATLAVPDIISSTRFKHPVVYTFASPRVGDSQYAKTYNGLCGSRSFRIANTCDLLASMPFPVPFLGFIGGYFTHVETPVEFTVQREDIEKNHEIGTYLSALEEHQSQKGLLQSIFK